MVGSPDQFLLQPAHLVLKAPVVSFKVLRLHLQVMMVLIVQEVLLLLVMCVIRPMLLLMMSMVHPTLNTLVITLFSKSLPSSSSVFIQCYSLSSSTLNSNALLTNSSLQCWSHILLVCSRL